MSTKNQSRYGELNQTYVHGITRTIDRALKTVSSSIGYKSRSALP
ncbi:Uncharacterised protein [Cedecea neteri]|uniref:Uncharacterized protein n=1 Tax=Cedecea neteri TaxID=158822 RepID=A0A2X2V4R9_9ENTR|nr:Uncharacterised protein [Cedecea neteri]